MVREADHREEHDAADDQRQVDDEDSAHMSRNAR
jgi:hypothetical protein